LKALEPQLEPLLRSPDAAATSAASGRRQAKLSDALHHSTAAAN